jgi:hypothetical protein
MRRAAPAPPSSESLLQSTESRHSSRTYTNHQLTHPTQLHIVEAEAPHTAADACKSAKLLMHMSAIHHTTKMRICATFSRPACRSRTNLHTTHTDHQ